MDRQGRAMPPRGVYAPPPRPRVLRAADQGPFDWLVPFIPPFLRVNRETREAIVRAIRDACSRETLNTASQRIVETCRVHGRRMLWGSALSISWVMGLVWVQQNEHEFATAYVILSGFLALAASMISSSQVNHAGGLSAYSVFNKDGRRMMGSLSAEQFENEIRHRQPHHDDDDDILMRGRMSDDGDDSDQDDPDLIAALQQSLLEKKREERRARRSRRR